MPSSMASKTEDEPTAKPDGSKVAVNKEAAASFSYFTLYRYATWGELVLNFLALFAAILVGTAQVTYSVYICAYSQTDFIRTVTPAFALPRVQSPGEELCELWHCRFVVVWLSQTGRTTRMTEPSPCWSVQLPLSKQETRLRSNKPRSTPQRTIFDRKHSMTPSISSISESVPSYSAISSCRS